MGNSIKWLILISAVIVVVLAACRNSSDETSSMMDNQSQNKNSTEHTNDDSLNKDSSDHPSNTNSTDTNTSNENHNDLNEKVDTSNDVSAKEEESSINHTQASRKEEYLKKLEDTKRKTEESEATDSSTYALKRVENDRWEIWDELLNEIYGVLKEQLSSEEMDHLREEQRNWIKFRDARALKASQKYKGGTQEHLEYVSVLANLTEERCYELVANYLK
jgi:uncharacterized protein YecT (DUF1311 family)